MFKKKNHKCWSKNSKIKFTDPYSFITDKTRKVMYIDNTGRIYKEYFTFEEENHSGKRKENILEKRNISEESEYNA